MTWIASFSTVPSENYTRTKPFLIDRNEAYKFYDFLFPFKAEEFRFNFNNTEGEFSLTDNDSQCIQAKPIDDGETFHILFSCDSNQKVGLFALTNSIVRNTKTPEKLHIPVVPVCGVENHYFISKQSIEFDIKNSLIRSRVIVHKYVEKEFFRCFSISYY